MQCNAKCKQTLRYRSALVRETGRLLRWTPAGNGRRVVGTYERNLAVATLPDRTTAVPFRLCLVFRRATVSRFPRLNTTRLLSPIVRQRRIRCFTNNCCKMADDNKTVVAVKYERLDNAHQQHIVRSYERLKDILFPQSTRSLVIIPRAIRNGRDTDLSYHVGPRSLGLL